MRYWCFVFVNEFVIRFKGEKVFFERFKNGKLLFGWCDWWGRISLFYGWW